MWIMQKNMKHVHGYLTISQLKNSKYMNGKTVWYVAAAMWEEAEIRYHPVLERENLCTDFLYYCKIR